MLNKRILSLLLAIVLVVGLMPTSVFATETEGTTAPTESVPETTGEAIEPQNEEDPTPCGICNVVDCGVEHKYCEKCEVYDCGKAHVICEVCKVEDCGVEHKQCDLCGEYDCDGNDVFCDTCNAWNCGKLHNITCETCGKVDCEGHDVTIPDLIPTPPVDDKTEDETEEEKQCTCTPAEDGTHSTDCPQYVEPTETEEEEVEFDVEAAHEYLMSLETKEEIEEYLSSLTEEEVAALAETITEEDAMVLGPRLGYKIEYEEYNPIMDYTSVGPLMPPVVVPARTFRLMRTGRASDNGLILSKVSTPIEGGYKITLEAYTTGTVTNSSVSVPTDIVLVLDESGSMLDSMYQYEETYDVTPGNTYYVKNGDTYTAVSYCDKGGCDGWKTGSHIWFLVWLFHYGNEVGDPMTSATDTTEGRVQFYKRDETSTTKRDALEAAATKFVNSVYNDAVANNVDHRIAVVGFAGNDNSTIKVGLEDDIRNNRGDTSTRGSVLYEVNNLNANGGTYIEDGLANAKTAFDQAATTTSTTRNRVVVVFTDGVPGSGEWGNSTITNSANPAITTAKTLKTAPNDGYGATVYTIGMLDDADPTLEISDEDDDAARTNKFLHYMSSNYPNASSMSNGGTGGGNKGYYLAASDSDSLNTIFEKIANQISTPTISLDGDTVVKDIVAPQFDIPAGATIHTYTADYDGESFGTREEVKLDTTVDGDTVTVTGFNFNDNFISETGRGDGNAFYGKKLIIEFTVTVDPNFLGGNAVATNGATSGVYSDNGMVEAFEVPTTDIAVKEIETVTANQNIYLSNAADIDALVSGLDSRINGTNNSHVKITYTIKDSEGDPVATLAIPAGSAAPTELIWTAADGALAPKLESDAVYTITATATPVSAGTAKASSKDALATVTVYKPFVTFQDTSVNAGDSANFDGPSEENRNLVKVEWKNAAGEQANANEMGAAPELIYDYDKEEGSLSVETEVKVTSVMANNMEIISGVTFYRDTCTAANGCDHVNDGKPVEAGAVNFIVHIKTFDLTITKKGVDVNKDGAAPFVFNVKGGDIDMNVVIYGNNSVTIKGLPAGIYTVKEVNGYWRYDIASDDTASKTVTPSGTTASVAFKNARTEDKWLDDWAKATNNFG